MTSNERGTTATSPERSDRPPAPRVGVLGLGVLGRAVATGVATHPDLRLVAAADIDSELHGEALDLEGIDQTLPEVTASLPLEELDVVAVHTASWVDDVAPTIIEILSAGCSVITAAEELTYPWHSHPEWSERLDSAAREGNAALLGVGANPGLLMDTLPTVLSLATQGVRSVRATRTIDLRVHGPARLRRFGLGMTREQFEQTDPSILHGHVGFRQSIDALGDALGWRIVNLAQHPVRIEVVGEETRRGPRAELPPGAVAVVGQRAEASFEGGFEIELSEYFGFVEDGDAVPRGDTWTMECVEQTIELVASAGVHSFSTTPATVVNMIQPLVGSAPGLRTIGEFPVRDLASKGGAKASNIQETTL